MDIKSTLSAARILFDGIFLGKPNFTKLPFIPAKTELLSPDDGAFLPKATPKAAHIDGERLSAFVKHLSDDPLADVHSVVVLSHGKCVLEASKAGYDTRMPHATFSMCKTLTGLAVGFLCEDGALRLTDKIVSFFPEYKSTGAVRALTVKHLLSMSTGIDINETNSVTDEDIIKAYLSSSVRFAPGTAFSYNSINSYLLAAIVTRVCGRSLSDFLKERLFDPLEIKSFFWETTACGVEKGGWGLYLSARAMAKIGQLFLSDGKWNGKQIISARWLRIMTQKQTEVPEAQGAIFDYGYHIWVHKTDGSLLLNGMFGQNILLLPDRDTVIAITAGENSIFHDARSLIAARKILGGTLHTPKDSHRAKSQRRRLTKYFGEGGSFTPTKSSREQKEAREALSSSLFDTYRVSKNNSALLPLMTRLVQNSPSKGITALSLALGKDGRVLLTLRENDAVYRLEAAERRFHAGELNIREEKYRYAAAYSFGRDENRIPFFQLDIRFPELPNTRRMLFRKTKDGYLLWMDEHPSVPFVRRLMHALPYLIGEGQITAFSKYKTPVDFVLHKTKNAFSPLLHLTKISKEV